MKNAKREWVAPYRPIRLLPKAEEERGGLAIDLGFTPGRCAFCARPRIDHCYNCERAICRRHSQLWIFGETANGKPLIVLAICLECQ